MEKKKKPVTAEQDALEHIMAGRDKPFLEERYIDSIKGKGVFTHKVIKPSSFVVEFRGKIFSCEDATSSRKRGAAVNDYLFEFPWRGARWCIDASKEDRTLGRLVNDDHVSPNCETKIIVYEGKPHMCLFAVNVITPGEEITYNYGDAVYPWRSKLEDSDAASSVENSENSDDDYEQDDDYDNNDDDADDDTLRDNSPSPENGRSGCIRRKRRNSNSSQEMTPTFKVPPDDASCAQRGDGAPLSSDDAGSNDECDSSEDLKNSNVRFCSTRNYCYVCGKGLKKLSRHLARHADEEPDIAAALAFPKNSKERKRILSELRNRGNYKHNQEVLRSKRGLLKVNRLSTTKSDSPPIAKVPVHCQYCKVMMQRKDLWRHMARCTFRPSMSVIETDGKTGGSGEMADSPRKISSNVWKLLSNMKPDQIVSTIQNDFLLMQLAQSLLERYRDYPNKHKCVLQKLREMGRLLLALHNKSIFNFKDAISPKNFYHVADAVKEIAGFDKKTKGYSKPTLALKMGHMLKKIAAITLTVVRGNEQMSRDTKTFMHLCRKEWSQLVSQTAAASLGGRKVNNPSTIPFTQDVQVFYTYLERSSASAVEALKTQENPQVYHALCRVTLAQVCVLNKGAPEVSKMRLKTFQERGDSTQVLSKHFIRIIIVSRAGQNVAVLLTSELVDAITLLVSKREACGVHGDNPFLFAKPNSSPTSLFHGGNCVRSFSSLCRAKNPEHLRSVQLHKHIARIFQILHLENDELRHLANLLGHDIRDDREYYRTPRGALELAKIAKLLLAMEKGSLQEFKGNSLDEIEIEDELEPEAEQGSPDNSEAEEDKQASDSLPQQSDKRQLTPKEDAMKHIKSRTDKPFLEEKIIDPLKGRGLFTRQCIEPSSFVVEYRGNISRLTETRKCADSLDNFLFDFTWRGENWRIDALEEDGSLGRLVNDDHISPNCKMKKIVYEGKPHLCLFASKKISAGEEICYDYGDSSYPWRPEQSGGTSQTHAATSSPLNESGEDSADEYVPDGNDNDISTSNKKKHPDSDGDASGAKQEDEAVYSSDDFTTDEEPEKTSRTNRNYCYVCGKDYKKLARHLFTHRKQEPDIAQVYALPPNSKKRQHLLEVLRNRGNYKHNKEVLRTRRGKLKLKRKVDTSKGATPFATCLYCRAMCARKMMWRHLQRCSAHKRSKCPIGHKSKVLSLVDVAASFDPPDTSEVNELLKNLKQDEAGTLACNDPLIVQLVKCLYHMNPKQSTKKKYQYISYRLRLMGQLLLTLKKKSICSFEDAVKPQNFSKLVEAVREMAGFNEEKKSCSSPSILTCLGCTLKKLGDIVFAKAMKEEADEQTVRKAEAFMNLATTEWSSVPLTRSRQSAPTVDFTRDVQLLHIHMEEIAASAVQTLSQYESPQVYNALLRVTVAQVSVLNRNKETSKVTLKSFNERDEAELPEDADACQSQLDQILSTRLVKLNLLSSKGEKVPVMLTPDVLSAITLLVSKRQACGVHEDNPFLFARPVPIKISFCQGNACISAFASRCGTGSSANLRSVYFRGHVARVIQILSLTNDQLEQLAKLLGRDIRTDREYYQTPEAVVDIAKIVELLLAVENGSLERFEGKSFEEIEFADVLEPDSDEDNPDAENNESLLELSNIFPSKDPILPQTKTNRFSSKKRGKRRRKRRERVASELNDDKTEEVDAEMDDMSECLDIDTPEKTFTRGAEETTKISFSDDDDEDMNVDLNLDYDDDSVRNEENAGDDDTCGSGAMPLFDNDSSDGEDAGGAQEENGAGVVDAGATVDDDESDQDHKKGGEQPDMKDVDSRSSSPVFRAEKKKKLPAADPRIKDLKIVIPKLNIAMQQTPVHISRLSTVCSPKKSPTAKDPPVSKDNSQCPRSSTPRDKAIYAKPVEMSCSHCKKSMLKGQTAFQKKGFADVFCSKSCLFQLFPINKPGTKTCFYCHKAISQPLDLIMAAVDTKGTMKDFCSVACLSSFKSSTASTQTPPSVCNMCNKSCTPTCEVTLNQTVHRFCSSSCWEDFRKGNLAVCDVCSCSCHSKVLRLRLEEETKTICSDECVEEFKENTKTSYHCTMCDVSVPMSKMLHHKNHKDVFELFCSRSCVISYSTQAEIVDKRQEGKRSVLLKRKRDGPEDTEDANGSGQTAPAPAPAPPSESKRYLAKSDVACRHCGKKRKKGEPVYKLRSTLEDFCSHSCLSERHLQINSVVKKCYNCFQVITRPHNIILAPVDDSGCMKELCSNTCLASVNSKKTTAGRKLKSRTEPPAECRMCGKLLICKFKLILPGGLTDRICSDGCFTNYHKEKNLPRPTCHVCSAVCRDKQLMLRLEDGSKAVCSDECLVKFKQGVKTPRLCLMCLTPHLMSDMVEGKNAEGELDFFCSNRCMMVHKAQCVTTSGRSSPSYDENDVKEVKPLPNLDCIKEEPSDEEYNQKLSPSISTEDIKDEPHVAKEDLMTGSVSSLTGDSESTKPLIYNRDLPTSCSNCEKVLMDGETVYQRKGHTDMFCSTSCILKLQQKQAKKTCHFCLQTITQSQDALQAPVESEEMKDFCNQTCLSSFNYSTIKSPKTPVTPAPSHSNCCMCSRYCISKHEITQQDVVHKICSDPCFRRFVNMNKLSVCVNCLSHCSSAVMLQTEDGSKRLCSAECLAQFKQKIDSPQPCAMCRAPRPVSDMLENRNSEDVVQLFCTYSCVMASKIQAVSASGVPLNCDNCGKTSVPACHLAMPDTSIRNFCTLSCAMAFKESQRDLTPGPGDPNQTPEDFLKPPEKLPCAQCRRIIKTTPKVVQKNDKINFVCSLACSQEFRRENNIMAKCENCKNEKIIRDVKRVDGRDCYFCSDGCRMLFRHELGKMWGQYCHSCAFCLSISKTLVTAQYKGTEEEFCSDECNSKYNMLFSHAAKCDTCGREGELSQSLPLLGDVKHFCDLKCLLHFCNKKVNTPSSPPGSAGTAESSLVIANVVSLADALARRVAADALARRAAAAAALARRASAAITTATTAAAAATATTTVTTSSTQTQTLFCAPDTQSKVVGHASVQTVSKELKNKSMLCTPLVHNKGVSCTTQTVDTEAQTDNFVPLAVPVPIPVPVYVPLPMNMYTQYTPKPVGLPLPLPVPLFLPEPPAKETKEPEPCKEKKKTGDERSKREEGRAVVKDKTDKTKQKQRNHARKERTGSDHHTTSSHRLRSASDTRSLNRPPAHEEPPPAQQLQQLSNATRQDAPQRGLTSQKPHKLQSQYGLDAWKRWTQWRELQISLDLVCSRSAHAVAFNEDILRCPAAELSDALRYFITEVKGPDGGPYSPDSLFYLCLGIQQYLFENGRMENIFCDLIYSNFSVEFTKILRGFKPSITASGLIQSCVVEDFLWDCKQLGAYSPIVLLNTLLFFCCKYFGFTTVQQHRQLSFGHIQRCTRTNQDYTRTSFLRFYLPVSMNEAEQGAYGVPAKKQKKHLGNENFLELTENTENPLRCPVRLYEFYLSKCPEAVRQRTDLFYLCPDRSCVPSSPLWFSFAPLDDGTLEAMLVRLLTVREVQGEYRGGVDQPASEGAVYF